MEPSMLFVLLAIITVSASSHPLETLDTTTSSPDARSEDFTVPSSVVNSGNNNSNIKAPHKSNGDEIRLDISLKADESDKELKESIDNDLGKYLHRLTTPANLS